MATSGSYDWTATRNDIIKRALRIAGVINHGEQPNASQIKDGADILNSMVKSWQNEQIFLWDREWTTKTLDTASSEVTGTDSNIYTCIKGHTSSATDKPITGANYTSYWTQRGSTGGVWATSTSYAALGDFTLTDEDTIGIQQAFLRDGTNDTEIRIITYSEYLAITNKTVTGRPNLLMFDRALNPRVYIYPQPDLTTYVLNYLRIRKLQDFDSSVDNPDFPERWIEAIVWNLAVKWSHEVKDLSSVRRQEIKREAEETKFFAKSDANEKDDLTIAPYLENYDDGWRR